jgi:amino acid transporter
VLNTESTGLVRGIGRWSLVALMVNSVIGSSVFGLPSTLVGLLGSLSAVAVLLAGLVMAVIVGCYAEVASQFTASGGPYLYARVAFGRLIGIQMGWMLWLAQLAATAANANLFVIYLGEFWAGARQPIARFVILTLLIGVIAAINYRGVRAGTRVSNAFTVAKLAPLVLVIAAGSAFVLRHPRLGAVTSQSGVHPWLKAMFLLIFFYGGFETALAATGEAENPQRRVVFALFAALAVCTVIYSLIQWTTVGILPDAASSPRPLADLAQFTMGRAGAALVSLGALVALCGYLSAKILAVPRVIYALAEHDDLPRYFASIHPRYHTPGVAIAAFATLMWVLAVAGSFEWNVTLSAVARLFYYAVGCAALPALRRKQPGAAQFRLPAGRVLSMLGIVICMTLATQVERSGSIVLFATVGLAYLNWLLVKQKRRHTSGFGA